MTRILSGQPPVFLRDMGRLVPLFFVLVLRSITPPASAQQHFLYGFVGGTMASNYGIGNVLRYGAGAEARIAPWVTLGGEAGAVRTNPLGAIGSVNATVHLGRVMRSDALDPFGTAGVSYAYAGGEGGLFKNLGFGMHYWFKPRVGLRGELRAYPGGRDLTGFAEFRLGIAFR